MIAATFFMLMITAIFCGALWSAYTGYMSDVYNDAACKFRKIGVQMEPF